MTDTPISEPDVLVTSVQDNPAAPQPDAVISPANKDDAVSDEFSSEHDDAFKAMVRRNLNWLQAELQLLSIGHTEDVRSVLNP